VIPMFNPPRRRKYHGGGIARTCRAHGLRGRWRKSSRRKKYRALARRLMRRSHRRVRSHRRRAKSLASQFSSALQSLWGASGTSRQRHAERRLRRVSSRIAAGKRRAASKAERDANRARRLAAEQSYASARQDKLADLAFMNPGRRKHMR